jgi:hypothetical protein
MIHHPLSPFKGQRYSKPVELIDIVPTLIDILAFPFNRTHVYRGFPKTYARPEIPFQGKSLGRVILGERRRPLYNKRGGRGGRGTGAIDSKRERKRSIAASMRQLQQRQQPVNKDVVVNITMPKLSRTFALTQVLKCAHVSLADQDPRHNETLAQQKPVIWNDCDIYKTDTADEVAVMGYSMRTSNYRYTAWIYVSRPDFYPNWTQPLFAERYTR